jgi:hypothetical protein
MDVLQETTLEECMKLAVETPERWPAFLSMLLDSTVYFLGSANAIEGAADAQTGSAIALVQWKLSDGTSIVPFFTTLEILQQSIDSPQPFLALPCKTLFELTLGRTLVLNPKSEISKTLSPDDIRRALFPEPVVDRGAVSGTAVTPPSRPGGLCRWIKSLFGNRRLS